MRRRLGAAAVALALGAGAPLAAQEKVALERAEEMARMGRTEDARVALLRWWDEGYRGASRRDVQRALWLRGRLTVDPTQAAADYRRLVIEYPGGPFSDQALFRLAQAAFEVGDSAGTATDLDRLRLEYPGSPVTREAEAWIRAAGAMPAATKAGPEPVVERAPPRAEQASHAVQLGAFASRSRAEALLRRAGDAGFDARLVLVPGSELIRVRVGLFGAQEQASAILKRLTDLGFTAALVRDAHLEEGVGR